MAEGQFTSAERVYVDRDGNRVDAKDPKRHKLLVAAGGQLPMEDARKAGLVKDEGQAAEGSDATDDAAESGTGAIDPAEESARIQESAGGADSKKSAKKAASKKK